MYAFLDDFLEIFRGQISITDLKYNLSYKEARMLRDIRVKRKNEEAKALDKAGDGAKMAKFVEELPYM